MENSQIRRIYPTPLVDRSIRLHKLIRSYLAPKTILHPSQRCNNDDRFEKCARFAFESFARPLPPFCPSLKRWNFQQFASREISLDNSEQNRDPPPPSPNVCRAEQMFWFCVTIRINSVAGLFRAPHRLYFYFLFPTSDKRPWKGFGALGDKICRVI